MQSGQLKGAREAAEACLALSPEAAIKQQAEKLLATLRRDLN